MKGRNVARNTFKIRFYTKDANKNGLLPLMVRITVNGERSDFRAHDEIPPELWLPKAGMVAGRTTLANQINNNIRNITANLTNIYNRLFLAGEHITAEKIRNEHLGRTHSNHTLLAIFREHNDREQKLFDVGRRAKSTFNRYLLTYRRLEEYLKTEYHLTDIAMNELNYDFIYGFSTFLYSKYKVERNTAIKLIQIFRKIVLLAKRNDIIRKDPFEGFSLALDKVDPNFLDEPELQALMQRTFYNAPHLELTRDKFIFCCFTGLAFCDVEKLQKSEIKEFFDGQLWILTERQKNHIKVKVPLLDAANVIYHKYLHSRNDELLFPSSNHQNINRHLKTIALYCNIQKNLTFHMARHTFGTTVTTLHGVDLREVSKMMGHTNTKMTEHYARILDKKLSSTMIELNKQTSSLQKSFQI